MRKKLMLNYAMDKEEASEFLHKETKRVEDANMLKYELHWDTNRLLYMILHEVKKS